MPVFDAEETRREGSGLVVGKIASYCHFAMSWWGGDGKVKALEVGGRGGDFEVCLKLEQARSMLAVWFGCCGSRTGVVGMSRSLCVREARFQDVKGMGTVATTPV